MFGYTQAMDQLTNLIGSYLQFIFSLFLWVVVLIAGFIVAKIIISKALFQTSLKKFKDNKKSYLFVKIPPSSDQKEQAMEEFLRSIHRVLPNGTPLALEIASNNQFLRYYIIVPKEFRSVIESQLYAQYPEAEIEEKEDYLPNLSHAAFEELSTKRPSVYPINTYHTLEENLLKNLSAILSKTESGEEAIVQLASEQFSFASS